MAIPITRQLWVLVHRWAGLTIALFLMVAGMTGAILPFQEALTFLSRPQDAFVSRPSAHARPLDGASLAKQVERQTGGKVIFLPVDPAPDHVAVMGVVPRAGRAPLGYDTVWVDPFSGHVRLAFRYGILADGTQNIVPFLYQLHMNLATGPWGTLIMGSAALIWVFDCFVGFYLTLPLRRKGSAYAASWRARWKPAWTIRPHARGHKLNFDLHRAGGLWLWPMLLVFALSSVSYNLPGLYRAAMEPLGLSREFVPQSLKAPLDDPPLSLTQARAVGEVLMQAEAHRRGFSIRNSGALFYLPDAGLYAYTARTSLDPSTRREQTSIWFSARDGRKTRFDTPTGPSAADAFTQWLSLLHRAEVFGLPYRIFVSVLGLAVTMLSVTGAVIWMKKRAARLIRKQR